MIIPIGLALVFVLALVRLLSPPLFKRLSSSLRPGTVMGGALQKPLRPAGALINHTTRAIGAVSRHTLNAALFVPRLVLMRIPKGKKREIAAPSAKKDAAGPDHGEEMWMVVGLGNPGPTYDNTRHNIGFAAVDLLAAANNIDMKKLQKNAAVGQGLIRGKRVLLVKPMTFMNVSGESVVPLAKYYHIPKERILVIYDDLDLPLGKVRLRSKGGHGGHNGMRSIIAHLAGSQEFPRIKVGIDRPKQEGYPIANWVLGRFTAGEKPDVDAALKETMLTVESILTLGMEKAQSGVRI